MQCSALQQAFCSTSADLSIRFSINSDEQHANGERGLARGEHRSLLFRAQRLRARRLVAARSLASGLRGSGVRVFRHWQYIGE